MHALPKLSGKPQFALRPIHSVVREHLQALAAYSLRTSRLRSATVPTMRESSSSQLHTIFAVPITGGLESKTTNQLFQPTCETHATRQWR